MAKHVLQSDGDELDFALIGISSSDDQYRVVSLLNEVLGVKFFLSDYIPMNLKGGQLFNFSLYKFTDEKLALEYYLVPNSSNFEDPGVHQAATDLFAGQNIDESTRLIKELPKTDFFIILKGEMPDHYKYKIMTVLRSSGSFAQVQIIEPSGLPSRKNLIF